MSRWLLCSVLLAFGIANIAAGNVFAPAVAKVKHSPVLKNMVAVLAQASRGLGRGVLVASTSLLLVCTQMGCGTDDTDEAPQVITRFVTDNTSNEGKEENVYELHNYVGNYIAFVGDGDGSISTGYVTHIISKLDNLILESEDKGGWGEEEEEAISLHEVVGVMHRTHVLAGEEVSFKRVHGAMPHWGGGDDILPDHLFGTVDVVYVEAVLPEGSGEPTAVGVTVHSGAFAKDWQLQVVQWHDTVFLPINRVKFIDAVAFINAHE